jgi:hypothetical protein
MVNHSKNTKGLFKNVVETFPSLLANLENSNSLRREEIPQNLNQGIYVFYERGVPQYVGRSGREGRFKTRILEHSRPGSGHNTATFAFLIAKQSLEKDRPNISRVEVEKTPEFAAAKQRIAGMQIKFFQIDDSIVQTLFEVYAALELETPYNSWETH